MNKKPTKAPLAVPAAQTVAWEAFIKHHWPLSQGSRRDIKRLNGLRAAFEAGWSAARPERNDIPQPVYDPQNMNPHWAMKLDVDLSRSDHTISMTQHLGNITKGEVEKKKVVGDVSLALGGFVFVVSIDKVRYNIDAKPAIMQVFNLHKHLKKVPEKERPTRVQKAKTKSGR